MLKCPLSYWEASKVTPILRRELVKGLGNSDNRSLETQYLFRSKKTKLESNMSALSTFFLVRQCFSGDESILNQCLVKLRSPAGAACMDILTLEAS